MQILTLRCLSVSFASVLGSLEGALSHFAPIMNRDLARVALLAVAVALPTMAQEANLEMGYKPYGTYHGSDIETVSVTNGNLSVRIPLVSYPQRGDLQLNFGLAWDNLGFSAEVVCDPFGNNCKNLWDQCGSPVGGGCIGVFSYDDHDLRVSRQQLFCLLPSCSRGDSIFIYVARNGDNREQEMVDLGGGILRSTNAAGLYGS